MEEIDSGKVQGIPAEASLARLRKLIDHACQRSRHVIRARFKS